MIVYMDNLKRSKRKKVFSSLVAIFFIFMGLFLIWVSTIKLPDISTFKDRKIASSSKILDRTGTVVLYDINQSVRRTEVPLEEISPNIRNAVISIEDRMFYKHKGVRPTSFMRAVITNIISGDFSQGGSTITQQLVKNTLLTTDKTVTRKIKEWVLALKLERNFSKDQILQMYLNDSPLGGIIYGVEEASSAYFNKKAKDLTVAESAYIAAMIKAPTYYSPFGKNKDKLAERKNLVIKRMLDEGYINQEQYDGALIENVVFNTNATNSIKAPHFVFYIMDYLQEKYGIDAIESGGYIIKTTLDYDLQQKAELAVAAHTEENEKKYGATNSAMVVMDPKTGQILSMVGSRNYFDKKIDGAYNIATAKRQPGSSFKPFVYLEAFLKGYLPETVLFDVPTQFSTTCETDIESCYSPSNFDGKYKGPMSLRSALAESRNVPSVKLMYLVGIESVMETVRKLGITTLTKASDYGLSLVLGGGEVTLLDIVSSYGVIANSGVKNQTTGILEIRDRKGRVMEEYVQDSREVVDRNAVLTLNNVLSDGVARMPTFGDRITIPGVAVKTGTTNSDRDAWIIGYTPEIVAGVWSGNNNNTAMRSGGATVSGPIWKDFMTEALKIITPTPFEKPVVDADFSNLKPVLRGEWIVNRVAKVDILTGMPPTPNTPIQNTIEKNVTDVQDILYWVNKENPRGPAPSDPYNDPAFALWNPPVLVWWQENKSRFGY